MRLVSPIFLATLLLWTSGCTVGPDFEPPVLVDLPESFEDLVPRPDSGSTGGGAADSRDVDFEGGDLEAVSWWSHFGDPRLAALAERAIENNLELDIALSRVEETRALRRARGARLEPVVDGSLAGGRSRASARGPGPLAGLAQAGLADLENQQFTLTFDAAWELDLFGRLRRAREASEARLEASIEDRRALMLSIAADTARAYVEWTGADRRLVLAERNLDLQESSLEVVEGKVEAGLLSQFDFEILRAQVETTRAALSGLRVAREGAGHRLSVLLGLPPRQLAGELESVGPIPTPPAAVDTGLPADLLLRRPDVRRAEALLHAATADLGAAIGDRYPRVGIGGSRGFEGENLSDLFESASRIWSFGPRIDLPIFRGGELSAAVEAARARLEASGATWRLTVLLALEEVETTLLAFDESWSRLDALEQAALSAASASDAARVLFEEGLRDSLTLLDAQRSQTVLEDAKAQAEIERALRAIDLYRALGGGWRSLVEIDDSSRSKDSEAP